MIPRILEPELMDSDEDARQYDAMDHATVNTQFVTDLLSALDSAKPIRVLDLGAGTAQIPIELARRAPHVHITAVDAAESMLALARQNIAAAGLTDRIECVHADAKDLRAPLRVVAKHSDVTSFSRRSALSSRPKGDAEARRSGARGDDATSFPVVISNSILHHIPEPRHVIAEAIHVTAPAGLLFHRDLSRPRDEDELDRIVNNYAADATPYQRQLFADSLRAALTLDEMRGLVAELGFQAETVRVTSDRHWTWTATKPS